MTYYNFQVILRRGEDRKELEVVLQDNNFRNALTRLYGLVESRYSEWTMVRYYQHRG